MENKGSSKHRVCIDFRSLNTTSPKEEYPMPIAGMLINGASRHKIISFHDGNAGHNQFSMAEEDIFKMVFICLGFVGLFEWVVLAFGLKNAGVTSQKAMNLILHVLLSIILAIH